MIMVFKYVNDSFERKRINLAYIHVSRIRNSRLKRQQRFKLNAK